MEKKTFIFIGRSGCGKGTQADLLTEYLKKRGDITDENPAFYIETGEGFRQLIKGGSHTSTLSRDIADSGKLQPEFLAVWLWGGQMVERLKDNQVMILDGVARSRLEAEVLSSALKYYKQDEVYVVHLDVSREWSKERLRGRGRDDDKDSSDIEVRLNWYESTVEPAIEYFAGNEYYTYLKINGEQSIEEVHQEIISKLSYKHEILNSKY